MAEAPAAWGPLVLQQALMAVVRLSHSCPRCTQRGGAPHACPAASCTAPGTTEHPQGTVEEAPEVPTACKSQQPSETPLASSLAQGPERTCSVDMHCADLNL